jgi:SAM-dependent methyltransferase
MTHYDPAYVRRFYDDLGETEWQRLDGDPRGRVIFHIHEVLLREYVRAGDEVLEAGAGPGRFTLALARLGAFVTVGDISPVQLDLNRLKVTEAGFEGQVRERVLLDIVDLSQFPSGRFDAVVCYGSPLNYVWQQDRQALRELLRVTRAGGHLLLSVSSKTNPYLPWLVEQIKLHGVDAVKEASRTGLWPGDAHRMRTYSWSELKSLLDEQQCEVVAASASNLQARIEDLEVLRELEGDPEAWQAFLEWETELCREPGVIGAGSHIIAVAQRA